MFDLKNLSVDQLIAGRLRDLIPEFYDQAQAIENSPWHVYQSVFDHVVKVYYFLVLDLKDLHFLSPDHQDLFRSWLAERVGQVSRGEILYWVTILHDIAKPETLIHTADGIAYCPGHEVAGALKARIILKRIQNEIGLDTQDIEEITSIIKLHGQPHALIDSTKSKADCVTAFSEYRQKNPQLMLYLTFFALVDTKGSTLDHADPHELAFRIDVYQDVLNDLLSYSSSRS